MIYEKRSLRSNDIHYEGKNRLHLLIQSRLFYLQKCWLSFELRVFFGNRNRVNTGSWWVKQNIAKKTRKNEKSNCVYAHLYLAYIHTLLWFAYWIFGLVWVLVIFKEKVYMIFKSIIHDDHNLWGHARIRSLNQPVLSNEG